jgi:hypothetical protein
MAQPIKFESEEEEEEEEEGSSECHFEMERVKALL